MALAEECPHEAPKTTSSFICAISSRCLPIWVPIIVGEAGERLCCLDTNPEIEFLLHCIPATGLQLVGGGGEFSGAGPGDPSSFSVPYRLSGVGSRSGAARETPVEKRSQDSTRCEAKALPVRSPRSSVKWGRLSSSNPRSRGQQRPWWGPPVVKGRHLLYSVAGCSCVMTADCCLFRGQRAASASAPPGSETSAMHPSPRSAPSDWLPL